MLLHTYIPEAVGEEAELSIRISMLTYADVSYILNVRISGGTSHASAYVSIRNPHASAYVSIRNYISEAVDEEAEEQSMTYADVCGRMLTYADVC
jgi:hypothetical protein